MEAAMRRSLWSGHGVIIAVGIVLLILARIKADADYVAAIEDFRQTSQTEATAAAERVSSSFSQIYENLRTISLLPNIRRIERHAENLNSDARESTQQIYLNLHNDVAVSEIYVVPLDLDPERVDPVTQRPEAPIIVFDEADGIAPARPANYPLEEIYEYRQLREQMQYFKAHYPNRSSFAGSTTPHVGSPELIICDNSLFCRTPADADRRGIVLSVPYYGFDGELRGGVSAIVPTPAIRAMLPARDYALINPGYGYIALSPAPGQQDPSRTWIEQFKPDPNLVFSNIIPVSTADTRQPWQLWAGFPDSRLLQGTEMMANKGFEYGSYGVITLLMAVCAASWTLLRSSVLAREQELAAEAANRAKSLFLAVMSHEIRTPMNAVLGLASTLKETNLDDDQRKSVDAIHQAGDNLLEILNDILDFSKLEAGELSFESIAFSPRQLIDNTISIIGPRAAAKGIAVQGLTDPAVPIAMTGDAGRIRQVLLNLMSNAVKFTEVGEVTVSVHLITTNTEQATIEWRIRDTGIGIRPEEIGTLFKDFTQADSSINRRFGGSGLGLSICKRLLDRMGGDISVDSSPGKGSTFKFTITLPLADSQTIDAPEPEDGMAQLKLKLSGLSRPLRLLIADDNATNRLVVAKMLREFDMQLHMVCDGAEAITAAFQFPFDLALMDVHMPEMDGLRATRIIRGRGKLASLPIIAFTANAFADDVKACFDAGMNDFVAKPVRKNVLVRAILRQLNASKPDLNPEAAASAALQSASLIDRARFNMLVLEVGAEIAHDLLNVFLQGTEQRLLRLAQLTGETDRKTVQREAHSLKSDAATFGWRELSRVAAILEKEAPELQEHRYRSLQTELSQLYQHTKHEWTVCGGRETVGAAA
jgi:signal transduction histidine kinase/CheY-like chemotaxis protein/HPt (histidine-containing phosphotransfer) domain-containing protein